MTQAIKKLSPTQQEVLDRMRAGWRLCWEHLANRNYLRRWGSLKTQKTVSQATVDALLIKGYIDVDQGQRIDTFKTFYVIKGRK